jgi:prepilin-type N-terminal cleavage/methylation domain-containing protein
MLRSIRSIRVSQFVIRLFVTPAREVYPANMQLRRTDSPGFTLIELLIVVAIIAILAAIAVPNFLEAQVRAKVARSRNDMRTLATALESFAVDHSAYPFVDNKVDYTEKLAPLTTPVGYITSVPVQAFAAWTPFGGKTTTVYYYNDRRTCDWMYEMFPDWGNSWYYYDADGNHKWYLSSVGPDGDYDQSWDGTPNCNNHPYDPTNGSVSDGDIIRVGP